MKICPTCKQEKTESDFGISKTRYDGLQVYCKLCKRKRENLYYKSSEERRIRIRRNNRASVERIRKYLFAFFSENSCVDCGESDILVLETDHRDPSQKEFNLSRVAGIGRIAGLKKVVAELAKCDVRCANCHRRKHVIERGDWRVKYLEKADGEVVSFLSPK